MPSVAACGRNAPIIEHLGNSAKACNALGLDRFDDGKQIGCKGTSPRPPGLRRSPPAEFRVLQVFRPPSLTPRAFAAASAALVRSEMARRSSSATIAIREIFAALADRMRQRTDLAVRLGLDVRRAPGDTTRLDALLRRFAEHFVRQQWPGPRLPEVFYDPRSLAEVGPRAARQPSCEMRSGAGRQGRGVVDDRSTSGKLVFGVARRRVLRQVLTGFPARRSPPRSWVLLGSRSLEPAEALTSCQP